MSVETIKRCDVCRHVFEDDENVFYRRVVLYDVSGDDPTPVEDIEREHVCTGCAINIDKHIEAIARARKPRQKKPGAANPDSCEPHSPEDG